MHAIYAEQLSQQFPSRRAGSLPARSIVLAAVCLLLLGLAGLPMAAAQDFAARALHYVAGQQGLAVAELEIIEAARAHLPLTGLELAEFKVLAPDGRGFGISFDVATGAVVDPELVAARERQARVATYGKLAPGLHARLQHSPAERIPVAIWVALPDPDDLARGPNPDLPTLATRVRAAQTPAAEAARALGAVIKLADLVPVLFAELTAGQINGLARHPAVVAIDYIPQHYTRLIDDAATSNRYPFVWSTTTGAGIKIAVHEDDGVDNVNPFLNNPTHNVLYWDASHPNIDNHATNVAGVIASTHNWRRGGAFGISQILSANFGPPPWEPPPSRGRRGLGQLGDQQRRRHDQHELGLLQLRPPRLL